MTIATRMRMGRGQWLTSPAQIASLALWLDATQISGPPSDGTALGTWADLSGNSRDFTQATGANQPLYKTAILNGKPVVRFDGSNDTLFRTAAVVSSGDLTVMAVVRLAATTDGMIPFTQRKSDNATPIYGQLRISSAKLSADWRNDAGSLSTSAPAVTVATGGAYVFTSHLSGTTLTGRTNGTAGTPATVAGGALTVDRASAGSEVTNPAGGYLNGDLGEVVIYAAALSLVQIQQVERYLGAKWGVGVL